MPVVIAEATEATQNASPSRLLLCLLELSRSSRTALIDDPGELSFAELAGRAITLAESLVSGGLGGKRVALLAPQDRHWPIAFWGILCAGATVVPLSPLHPLPEQQGFLRRSKADALVVAGDCDREGALAHPARIHYQAGERWPQPVGVSLPGQVAQLAESHTALILYTSGTTGAPKGVLFSHRSLFEGVRTLSEAWGFTPQDTLLHALPLHHLHGIAVSLLCALCSGATTHMLPRYDARRVLELLPSATVLMGVPTQHKKLMDEFDSLPEGEALEVARSGLQGLRLITSGSAKLPEQVGLRMLAASGQYPLERYGMTEVGIVLGNPLFGERVRGSCGRPLPRCDIRIVDEGGQEVRPGEPGEIWISAPSVFDGYDGDPQGTAAAFTGRYFRSGDTATWTPEGDVLILGRTSVDIIKSGGYKLSALEIEEQLRMHPEIEDAAVVGIADDTWGERVVAVVVCDRERQPDAWAEGVRAWLRERIAGYKVPKEVLVWKELPRNALGKVTKPQLIAALTQHPRGA